MRWILATLALLVAGVVLRRMLRLDGVSSWRGRKLLRLDQERESIYEPVFQEIETQATILGISLNDAIEEHKAGNADIAWRLVRLSVSEWDRLTEITTVLLNAMSKHLSHAQVAIPSRNIVAGHFKSQVMVDYVRMHELLDQLVFRSKLKFQLHIRLLRRATETLSTEFWRAYRVADSTEDRPPELWTRLDYYFHDFDLTTKEALLALRALLLSLPDAQLPTLAADLKSVTRRGVRTAAVTTAR